MTLMMKLKNNMKKKFHKAINDDLNMPLAMGAVWEVVRSEKKSPKLAKLLLKFDTVLGIDIDKENKEEKPRNSRRNIKIIRTKKTSKRKQRLGKIR